MESPRLPFLPAPLFSSTSSFYASRPPSSPLLLPPCSSSPTPIFPSPPFNFFPPPPLLPPPTPPRSEEVWFPKSKWKNLCSGSRPFSSGTSYFLARSTMTHPSTSQQTAEVKRHMSKLWAFFVWFLISILFHLFIWKILCTFHMFWGLVTREGMKEEVWWYWWWYLLREFYNQFAESGKEEKKGKRKKSIDGGKIFLKS